MNWVQKTLLFSMGSKGSCVLSKNEFIHFEGQKPDEVISTVGAGDTVIVANFIRNLN